MHYDENNEEPLTTPDTPNRTRLNPSEGRSRKQDYGPGDYWRRLSTLNTGAADSYGNYNDKLVGNQERLVAYDVMADHLGLSSYQKREGRRIIEDLNFGAGGLGVELHLGAYCLAALIVREDQRADRIYHPQRSDENNDSTFLAVAEQFEFRSKRIHSVINKLYYHVAEF